jgi:cyclopropane-fatty-acyl-phospholipid synthase
MIDRLIDRGVIPDRVLRAGIRRLLDQRLRDEGRYDEALRFARRGKVFATLEQAPIAVAADRANEQHYEVDPELFAVVLGHRLKYSCGYFPTGTESLDSGEDAMLELTADRAGLADGQAILDLGCGWGALSLWAAERFPNAAILAVSNANNQRTFIESRARERNLGNLHVITADVSTLELDRRFDRIVSVEMFEHVRNHSRLLRRIRQWLHDDGRLFVHTFCHQTLTYTFDGQGSSDWMARHFFTGGLMPSADLLERWSDDLSVEQRWLVGGRHYARTLELWLRRLDLCRDQVLKALERTYGRADRDRWYRRWRVFFMACAELFAYAGGTEWMVAHQVLRPTRPLVGARA